LFYFISFWASVCKTVRPNSMLSNRCLSVCPDCLSCLWHWCTVAKRLDGSIWKLACRKASALATLCWMETQLPFLKKGGGAPQFLVHVYCGQTAVWIEMALGMEVRLRPGHIVLDRDPAPPSKMGQSPQFSAHFYCGQTAVCIRIPLGTELGVNLGDIVSDGDTAPPPLKGHSPPVFGQCLLWPNGWMD